MAARRQREEAESITQILVIRAGALGDVLLTRQAMACLRRRFPRAAVTLVAPLPQARLALWGGLADRVVGFDEPALGPLVTGDARKWPPQLEIPDLLVAWVRDHGAVRTGASRLGVRETLGCAPLDAISARRHMADWLSASLAPMCECADPPPLLAAPGTDGQSSGYVVLHPGSGSARKNYPDWTAVMARLEVRMPVCVLHGPADSAAIDGLVAAWPAGLPAPRLVRDPSLDELARLLGGATLYLGNDSGVSHLAAATGAPSVVVFGPTDPEIWKPVGPCVTALGGTRVNGGIFSESPVWPSVGEVVDAVQRALA